MVNYFYDCYTVLNKVYSQGAFIKQAITGTFIEPQNRALTTKTCYGVLDKDIELSYYIKALTDKSPKLVIRTILKIGMYAIKYLNKKSYAVTENAVELTKKLGKKGASGFVNAFLRKFATAEIPLPTSKLELLSIKYSYPLFALEKLIEDYGEARAEKIISAKNAKTCLSFYDINGEEYLTAKGLAFSKTPFYNVFVLDNFTRDEGYDKGYYTYQSLGSVAICEGVAPAEKLLDCCSAPGGKSVRLSRKFKHVVSTDIHPHRVELINDYTGRMRVKNVTAMQADASVFNPSFENTFDAVLCDAPCSSMGVVNDNPDIKLNKSLENIIEISALQKKIISNVSKYVKLGGYLYYSTCSVFKCENIGVINGFLSENDNFVIENVDSPLPHDNINGTLAFMPDISGGNGYYFAKLKRVK